jgi:hypothetical protein
MKNVHSRGFALRDRVALMAFAVVGVAVFTPLAASAGGGSRMSVCMNRLKSISMSTSRYAADHQDRLASLQGRPGETVRWPSPGLNMTLAYSNTAEGNRSSAADQAIDILIRRSGLNLNRIINWIAPLSFSQLALSEYEQEPLPSARWACPEDWILQAWQANPLEYEGLGLPAPQGGPRWAFSSSYLR